MGDLEQMVDSSFKDVDCKSCEWSPYQGQVFVGEDELNCRDVESVETSLLLADFDLPSDEDDLNPLVLEELENLNIKQNICSPTTNKMISHISSPNTIELLNLSKCATILCSEVLQSCPEIFAKAELSNIELGCRSSSSFDSVAEDGTPFHGPSSKLISALKGSRARHGKPLDRNLHVKWAAYVYDPPVTSSSHTVKGHRHHRLAKAKKDHHKHKHYKSKTSSATNSGNAGRRSYQRSSSTLDPRMSRWQALPSVSLQAGFGQSKMREVLEESNCGGGFHAQSHWPFSPPVAEAS